MAHKLMTSAGEREFSLPVTVLTHHNCTDGFASYWAACQAFGGPENVKYVAGRHGEEGERDALAEIEPMADVLITDFSLSAEGMRRLCLFANTVTVLDHHQSALNTFKEADGFPELDNAFFELDMERSGAGITWDYLTNGSERPELLNYIEDRDLWKNSLPFYREIGAYMQTVEREYETFDRVMNTDLDEILPLAEGALLSRDLFVKESADNAAPAVFLLGDADTGETKEFFVVLTNTIYAVASEAAHEILERNPGIDVAGYFFIGSDHRVRYGFRSRPDAETTALEVATLMGGGGHVQAAGAGPFDGIQHLPVPWPCSHAEQ